MKSILIDPINRVVTVLTTDFSQVETIREVLDCTTYAVDPMNDTNHIVLPLNVEDKPGQRFWTFRGGVPFAGKALVRGNTADGLQAADVGIDPILLTQQVVWLDVEFDGWQTVPKFKPLTAAPPQQQLQAPAPEAPPPPKAKPWSIWTVTEDDTGYKASQVLVDEKGDAKRTGTVLENEDLDELRAMLPPGLQHQGRSDTDDPSIVETWMTPIQRKN